MSSFNSPLLVTIPFNCRRKSSSASTSVSIDTHAPLSSSPPPSSSPLLTPLHPAQSCEWPVGDYFDDYLDGAIYNQREDVDDVDYSWSFHTKPQHSTPYVHRPLPSSIAIFGPNTRRSDARLPYSPSPFSSIPQTAYFYPQGESAIADDCEEYDLESMDIHIRETYFATSAERGRWLSSPIASRARSQGAPSIRGHSSPVKTPTDTSPLGERLRKRPKSCTLDRQIFTSFSEDYNEDMRCSSPLPPSSPMLSPLSALSLLGDDYEGDTIVDPCSNSDDCHSFGRTPELSASPTTWTSPVESTHSPTLRGALATTSTLPPADFHTSDPTIPCHSSRRSHSPDPMGSCLDSDGILSPLSQFELDLPDAEPLKLPLSDMENKFYPEQRTTTPGVTADVVWSQNEPVQFNLNHDHLDVTLDTILAANSGKIMKRRNNATGNPATRRSKKRTATRSGSHSNMKKRRGAENHMSNHSEPASKKSKVSHCGDDSASRVNPCPERAKIEWLCQSPSHSEPGDSGSACALDTKSSSTSQAEQWIPVPVDAIDAGLHASLTGMLIEAFATSRATCMDSAALYLVLTQAHPYLGAERPKQELLMDIAAVLEAGRVRCGMFEKVDSSGERSRHKALESRWFYIPERDEDEERASLISAIMPRQKRNETKKYKQYYYRPLDKISRWDPEDAA